MRFAVPTVSELRPGLALAEALSELPLTPTEMRLFELLLHHRNRKTGQCNPSVGRLARLLRRCERTVQRGLGRLVELGLIKARWRKGGRHRTTWWGFLDPRGWWPAVEQVEESLVEEAPEAEPAPEQEAEVEPPAEAPEERQEGIRAMWCERWEQRAGRPYRWPQGGGDQRRHLKAARELAVLGLEPGLLEGAIGCYLEAESRLSAKPKQGPHGVWPHDAAPSLPKFTMGLRDWLELAERARPPDRTAAGVMPPGWDALSEPERRRVLEALGVSQLTPQVASYLLEPGVLEALVETLPGR